MELGDMEDMRTSVIDMGKTQERKRDYVAMAGWVKWNFPATMLAVDLIIYYNKVRQVSLVTYIYFKTLQSLISS